MNQIINFFCRDYSGAVSSFKAVAIIEHKGEMTDDGDGQGHYICDVRCKETNSWFRTNDNKIPSPISLQNVTKNAVVVLYKKVN